MAILCLDLGGSKSTGALFGPDEKVLGRAMGPAGAVSLGVAVTVAAVRHIWDQIGQGSARDTDLVIGLAGIGLRDRVAAVQTALSDFRSVRCVSDGYGALLDATGAAPGSLIVVGTGVVAMRLNPDGTFLTASGWGFPAGDQGGGAWIGLQATAALTLWIDGACGPGTMTAGLARALMGVTGTTASDIMDWLTGGKAGDYARLAPVIAASDDPCAHRIMARAAQEIATMADVLCDGRGGGVVHLSGGLGAVLRPWCMVAAPLHDWRVVDADPLRGLFLMASGQAPDEKLAPRPGLGLTDYDDAR